MQQLLAFSLLVIGCVRADLPLLQAADADAYNDGEFGERPAQSFFSTDAPGPRLLVNTWEPSLCSPESHISVTVSLGEDQRSPAIFSAKDLSLVWYDPSWYGGEGARPQQYNGSTYLTFTTASLGGDPFGGGKGWLLDDQYRVFDAIEPELEGGADSHEFVLTPEGTALMTNNHQKNLSDCSAYGGPVSGCEIYESGFQERDLATRETLFTWEASKHLPLIETARPYGRLTQGIGRGWDFFHINAVSKSKDGHYLVNSRHWGGVMLISRISGDRIWQLGGQANMFRDLSDGRATNFTGQHHTHFINDDETEIILFNNHLIGNNNSVTLHSPGCTENCSSVRRIRLDFDRMTAELVQEWHHPASVQARAKGGVEMLYSGNALVSWGVVPSVTEFTAEGTTCMDLQFGPWSNSVSGSNMLYRAYKFDYTATPYWDPAIAVLDDKVYVSWNGATEVDSWVLFGGMTESQMSELGTLPRMGFETMFEQHVPLPLFIRVEARDKNGKTLRSTRTVTTTPIIRP